jgi:hypothetical protein
MTALQNLSVEQLRKAVALKEQIEALLWEIKAIMGDGEAPAPAQDPGRKKMSPSERARVAVAARWAKARASKSGTEAETAPKKSGKFSTAHRAALAAAQKARWAKARSERLGSIAANPQSALMALARGAHYKLAIPSPKEDGSAPKKRRKRSAAGRARIAAAAKAR